MHLRRTTLLTGAVIAAIAIAPATTAVAAPGDAIDLTLLSTTDIHGHVLDWDYFSNAPYPAGEELGLARAGTLIEQVRAERGEESVLLVDNGDAIQGTPLTYDAGMRVPITETGQTHPMAAAFNALDYDAQVVGNHEYNYGLDLLDAYDAQLDAPLLAANALDATTGEPTLGTTTMVTRVIDGQTVNVGIVGVVTPGIRVWDKGIVEGHVDFQEPVLAAQAAVPELQAAGADVIVVLAHTGLDPASQTWDPSLLQENVATSIAEQVPGVDVIVSGHTHQDNPETIVAGPDGGQVLITQPVYWGSSVAETNLHLVPDADGFAVDWSDGVAPSSSQLYTQGAVAEDPEVVAAVADAHAATVEYVNTQIAVSTEEMSGATSRYEDTALIDFVNAVQTETLEAAVAGTDLAGATVISQASPFSRDVVFQDGAITVRDMAALYIYENTLMGVQLTGAELRDYLEYSARYFVQQEPGAAITADVAGAVDPVSGQTIPDYGYDVVDGVQYVFDISQPVGQRLATFTYPDGSPIGDDDVFVMGINNYRQSGGSGYPHVADAPVVYDELLELRQLLIDYATDNGEIDPADFADVNWSLTTMPVEVPPTDPAPTDPAPTDPAPTDPAPTSTTQPSPSDSTAPGAGSGSLPQTGAEVPGGLIALAAMLLVAGGLLVRSRMARKR